MTLIFKPPGKANKNVGALILLTQCNKTDAGSLSDIIRSILDVLKSIEGLLKDDSISLDTKSKYDSRIDQSQSGQNDISSTNESINIIINDTSKLKPDEDKKENSTDTIYVEGGLSRRSFAGKGDKSGDRHKTPKMRTKIQKESDEEEMNDSVEPNTSNDEEDDNMPDGDSTDNHENESESDNDNDEVAARLFEESDELKINGIKLTNDALKYSNGIFVIDSIIPADARYKGPAKQKKSVVRRELEESVESDAQIPADIQNSPKAINESRLPISKSLARKLSEMLTIAVAEAVAQVVEDEPTKLTACTALFRRRNYNSNVNQNYNYNTNTNANYRGLKKPVSPPAPVTPPPEEQEQVDDEISEEEDSIEAQVSEETEEEEDTDTIEDPSMEDERRDIKLPKDLLAKLKSKSVVRRPRPPIRSKNKNKNVNVNTNTNILSFRKDDSNRNDVATSEETDDATTEMPKPETKTNARRRMRHN
ncbi:hypothetical protein TSAR_016349 [Trichomalopsis sarcophagae]|uniref:Uncharacterized protein n=1 Tax=Trichomalopsis sarcophagae TaxID=543379 RepID=A0A232F5V5_9HYME|nr:hypothetical protein TSAR_016349 [Trichomalopsis sarcophagae]